MRTSIVGLVALGLIAAFSAALLMAAVGKTPNAARLSGSGDRDVTVLVAARDLPAVSKVHAEDLQERKIKAKDMPKGVMQDPINAVGKTLVRPLLAGEPVTSDCFASNNRGMELVSNLPPGKRAVTVELKLSDGLEGLLYPGSVVDVLAFFRFDGDMRKNVADAVSTTLLRGVEVLAIDDTTASTSEEDGTAKNNGALARAKTRRVTLLVDSRQAEALQLASAQGTVSLAMRNPQDTIEADRDGTLLSGGQLASLAEYLGAWVGEEPQAETSPEPAALFEASEPHNTMSNKKLSQWNVTVMRGDRVEVQSFVTDPDGEERVAERLN